MPEYLFANKDRPVEERDLVMKYFAPLGKLRLWRFDVAIPAHKIAWEIDGGVYRGGRHTRGVGFVSDMEKLNAAVMLGWQVIRTAPADIAQGARLVSRLVHDDKNRVL